MKHDVDDTVTNIFDIVPLLKDSHSFVVLLTNILLAHFFSDLRRIWLTAMLQSLDNNPQKLIKPS